MFNVFKTNKNKKLEIAIDKNNIPEHIAIIMDGNGRWAKQRKLPRTMGHKAGVETIRRVIKEAHILGIKYSTQTSSPLIVISVVKACPLSPTIIIILLSLIINISVTPTSKSKGKLSNKLSKYEEL